MTSLQDLLVNGGTSVDLPYIPRLKDVGYKAFL